MAKKSERKSIWGTDESETPKSELPVANTWGVRAAGADYSAPVVEQLRVVNNTRRRDWEAAHHSHAFRCVAPNVHTAVRAVAINEGCSVDQAAQALIEFGLACYRRGEVPIEPVLQKSRRTLFPEEQGKKGELRWTEKTWGLTPPKKRKSKAKSEQKARPWKDWPVVSYRLADATFTEIVEVCENRQANRGEVVTKLLMHALDAYEAGRLVLESDEPRPVLEEW